MDTKALAYGIIGFILGGLVVSTAAVTIEQRPDTMTMAHMLDGKSGEAFDEAFLSHMIIHHQDAIDMAMLAQENASHDEVKQLADDILATQSMEIDIMQSWQAEWGYKVAPANHVH